MGDFHADILAIAAHRDDIEQTCGGTLLKMAERGYRTAVLDLTQGEMGTRGTVDDRAREANEAARILKVGWRQALDIPDGRVENTYENRLKVARVIRQLRPRVLILPYWQARHPDHATASPLGYEACVSRRAGQARSRRPAASSLQDHLRQPLCRRAPDRSSSTSPRNSKLASRSLMAYRSQYEDQAAGSGLFPQQAEIRERTASWPAIYGLLAGVRYAEPFVQKEVGLVDDLLAIPVQSI